MEAQSTTPRLKEFGSWSEQTSSSGKRYYYNSASNISQWDKPAEWKQAEKIRASTSSSSSAAKNASGRTPNDKVSPTSSATPKVHVHSTQSHRQPSSSSSGNVYQRQSAAQSSTSSTNQQLKPDSSTSANKIPSSSARNSSSPSSLATKRQKLSEDGAAKMTNYVSSSSGKKPTGTTAHAQQQQTNSSATPGTSSHQHEIHQRTDERGDHRSTSGSFGNSQHHFQQPTNSPTSINKRPFNSSSASVADRNSANRDHQNHSSKPPTKFSSPSSFYSSSDQKTGKQQSPLLTGTSKPRPLNSINTSALALAALKDQQQQQRHQQFAASGNSVSNGRLPASSTSSSTIAATTDVKPVDVKPSIEGFREEKYQRIWRPEMSAHRRSIGIEAFMHGVKRHNERTTKQMASIFALDHDIHSIHTLDQTALLRTRLLQQRLGAVRQRVQELDSKGQ